MFKIVNKHNEGEAALSNSKARYISFALIKFTTLAFYYEQTLRTMLKTNERNEIFSMLNES